MWNLYSTVPMPCMVTVWEGLWRLSWRANCVRGDAANRCTCSHPPAGRRSFPNPYEPIRHLADLPMLEEIHKRYDSVPIQVMQDPELRELVVPCLRADITMLETYRHLASPPLACGITCFGATEDRAVTADAIGAWSIHTQSKFELHMFEEVISSSKVGAPDCFQPFERRSIRIHNRLAKPSWRGTTETAVRVQTNRPGREPIAIVGIGCRLPGASSVEELWNVLDNGVDTVGEYPGGRFPLIDAVYAGDYPGASVATRSGGFLPDIDQFDAEFFGILAREAAFLDPQHRLFFETAWEAMEDSRKLPRELGRYTDGGVRRALVQRLRDLYS